MSAAVLELRLFTDATLQGLCSTFSDCLSTSCSDVTVTQRKQCV